MRVRSCNFSSMTALRIRQVFSGSGREISGSTRNVIMITGMNRSNGFGSTDRAKCRSSVHGVAGTHRAAYEIGRFNADHVLIMLTVMLDSLYLVHTYASSSSAVVCRTGVAKRIVHVNCVHSSCSTRDSMSIDDAASASPSHSLSLRCHYVGGSNMPVPSTSIRLPHPRLLHHTAGAFQYSISHATTPDPRSSILLEDLSSGKQNDDAAHPPLSQISAHDDKPTQKWQQFVEV